MVTQDTEVDDTDDSNMVEVESDREVDPKQNKRMGTLFQ